MLIIQAMNVHQGGGLSLLLPLLESAVRNGPVIALLDRRLQGTHTWPEALQIHWVEPSVNSRFRAEKWLRQRAKPDDVVLCFGNLPPLSRLPCRVVLFVQNRLLVDKIALGMFSWKTRLRLYVERQWLTRAAANVESVVVQTPSMQKLVSDTLGIPLPDVSVCAFVPVLPDCALAPSTAFPTVAQVTQDAFVYPASGDPYKNHRVLVSAWALLRAEGMRPTLHLTVDKGLYPGLVEWIETERVQKDLSIVNHGHLPAGELAALYKNAAALVYPSLFESFGLPLLEARGAGLPVIAAELDYVRDVVAPVQTFDPSSAVSIARAVRRFLQQAPGTVKLATAAEFMKLVHPGRTDQRAAPVEPIQAVAQG
jgi:glycosyltransferase involved in cell wall biosynthesis